MLYYSAMRKQKRISILAGLFALGFLFSPALARGEIQLLQWKESQQAIWLSGESLWRYEMWDWFTPSGPQDYNYGYFLTRTRSSLRWTSPKIDALIQLQYNQFFDLPGAGSVAPAPQGPLGLGPIYFGQTGERFAHRLFLKQVYGDLKDPLGIGLSTRVGRFDFSEGAEVVSGDAKLDWVRKFRIAERLIGPFGFSAFTRSFDGAWAWWDQKKFRVDQLLARPTQGGFEESACNTIEKIDLLYSALTLKKSALLPNTVERAFFIRYADHRAVTQRVDNSGKSTAPNVDVDINTYGMDMAGAYPLGSGEIDSLFWLALQQGDWYELSHRAMAWDIEGGYQWKKTLWQPWLRMGYFQGSGDSNPGDTVHETFFQILPTGRQYAFFPLYNLMNNNDLFAQCILKPTKALSLRTDWHWLALNAQADRFYSGSGATQEKGGNFGYIGRNSFGKSGLGNLLDFSVGYDITSTLKVSTYYGHFFGGSVLDKIYPAGHDANFFFTEIHWRI